MQSFILRFSELGTHCVLEVDDEIIEVRSLFGSPIRIGDPIHYNNQIYRIVLIREEDHLFYIDGETHAE